MARKSSKRLCALLHGTAAAHDTSASSTLYEDDGSDDDNDDSFDSLESLNDADSLVSTLFIFTLIYVNHRRREYPLTGKSAPATRCLSLILMPLPLSSMSWSTSSVLPALPRELCQRGQTSSSSACATHTTMLAKTLCEHSLICALSRLSMPCRSTGMIFPLSAIGSRTPLSC